MIEKEEYSYNTLKMKTQKKRKLFKINCILQSFKRLVSKHPKFYIHFMFGVQKKSLKIRKPRNFQRTSLMK